jgi:hypothetical protein
MKIKVVTTSKAPYHKPNQTIEVDNLLADKMVSQGWATYECEAVEPIAEIPASEPEIIISEVKEKVTKPKKVKSKK